MVLDISTDELLRVERLRRFAQIEQAEAAADGLKAIEAELDTAVAEYVTLGKRIHKLRIEKQGAASCRVRAESAKAWLQYHPPEWITERMQELVAEQTGIIETMQPLEHRIGYIDSHILTAPMEERASMQQRRAEAKEEIAPLIERREELTQEIRELTKRTKCEAWPTP